MGNLPEDLRKWASWLESRSFACLDANRARETADEIERLTKLLNPVRADSEQGELKTINDYLSLLPAYIVDVMPGECPGDEYFAAWERLAGPVLEELAARAKEVSDE